MMTTSPVRRTNNIRINALREIPSRSGGRACAISIDGAARLAYLNRNRTPHASTSVCAPGGSFFALNAGKAGFQ